MVAGRVQTPVFTDETTQRAGHGHRCLHTPSHIAWRGDLRLETLQGAREPSDQNRTHRHVERCRRWTRVSEDHLDVAQIDPGLPPPPYRIRIQDVVQTSLRLSLSEPLEAISSKSSVDGG